MVPWGDQWSVSTAPVYSPGLSNKVGHGNVSWCCLQKAGSSLVSTASPPSAPQGLPASCHAQLYVQLGVPSWAAQKLPGSDVRVVSDVEVITRWWSFSRSRWKPVLSLPWLTSCDPSGSTRSHTSFHPYFLFPLNSFLSQALFTCCVSASTRTFFLMSAWLTLPLLWFNYHLLFLVHAISNYSPLSPRPWVYATPQHLPPPACQQHWAHSRCPTNSF